MQIKPIVKNVQGMISKNSPTILTCAAVGGLITTTILAVKATPKALEIIDQELYERMGDNMYGEEGSTTGDRIHLLPAKDIVRLTWKCYIPSVAVGTASVLCIIGANSIHLRRNAALASVYTITETAFKEYQAKVAETIGKNKERKVRDEIAADHVKANPPGANEIIITGKGEVLCYDTYSGRYFKNDIENIRKIENRLNKLLMYDDHITLNDLYYDFGLAPVKMGEELGWHIQTGLLEFRFSSTLSDDETPCLVVDYEVKPVFNY